jgi:dienelactone hydrolase
MRRVLVAATALSLLCWPSCGYAEPVKFNWSGSYPHNKDQLYTNENPHLSAWTTRFQNGAPEEKGKVQDRGQLSGDIRLPKGPGPFPFVVVLHGCTGLDPVMPWANDTARLFNGHGIGVLLLDSFGPRNVARSCGEGDYRWAVRRAEDAFSALDYLLERKIAISEKIFVMGRSNGGRATVLAMDARMERHAHRFAAGFALVPNCTSHETAQYYAPLVVFAAEHDDANPAKACIEMTQQSRKVPVRTIVFKNTFHGYMDKGRPYTFNGWRMAPNPRATASTLVDIVKLVKGDLSVATGVEYR